MRIALLSNVTADVLVALLKKEHRFWLPPGFGQWIQECLTPSSELVAFDPECILVLLDGRTTYEGGGQISIYKEAIISLSKNFPNAWILVSNLDVPQISIRPLAAPVGERQLESQWGEMVSDMTVSLANVCVFDLKQIAEDCGRKVFYDARMRYAGSIPFSLVGFKELAKLLQKMLRAYSGVRKKVIAIDLDNTLWKGVVGEDGASGVKLYPDKEGGPFSDFQRRIKELKEEGILLVCLSKNNLADVEPTWKDPRMILKEDDFVGFKIDWNDKPSNLLQLAKELNLGVDSFVFIDDNPAERERMKTAIPEVAVPDFPTDDANLEAFIAAVAAQYFPVVKLTKEDGEKTAQYRAEVARKALSSGIPIQDYLRSLMIEVIVKPISTLDIERVAQLSQKTNQFNVCTNRYTAGDIQTFAEDKSCVLLVARAKDKFGDNGLISFVFVKTFGERAKIVDFVMSCRVMNRTVETAVEDALEAILKEKGVRFLEAEYRKTAKNSPVARLFDQFGFSKRPGQGDVVEYELDLASRKPLVHYVKLIRE